MESEVGTLIVDILGFAGFILLILGAGSADSSNFLIPAVMFAFGLTLLLIASHENGGIKRWVTCHLKKLD